MHTYCLQIENETKKYTFHDLLTIKDGSFLFEVLDLVHNTLINLGYCDCYKFVGEIEIKNVWSKDFQIIEFFCE